MLAKQQLDKKLTQLDGRGYKAYKELQGNWYDFGNFYLGISHVQGDPFASPSKVQLRIKQREAAFPQWLLDKKIRIIAVEDYLTRTIAALIRKYVQGRRGSGKSGVISIAAIGQEVVERTSVEFNQEFLEARINLGLPASGRRVLAREAREMFFKELPLLVEKGLYYSALDADALARHVQVVEEQEILREKLPEKKLVAFVANGSLLPRRSGIDDGPLQSGQVVPFQSPREYEVEFELPYTGKIRGLGIKEGVTLIVGGGYHGKSTLLNALEKAVYNHIPGDGREYVVTREDAYKIRAEDGRGVSKVDISPFINNLPQGDSTKEFSTANASGSTSQAANIMEALELGSGLLLIDEDTCATNFMIRDARMQKLVSKKKEPITPFIDKIKPLYRDYGVSSILVVGGAGDYFDVADQVIMMDEYRPRAVLAEVQQIARELPSKRIREESEDFGAVGQRVPVPASINPYQGRKLKVKAKGRALIHFGREIIDLNLVEQLLNGEQTRAIADILVFALQQKIIDGRRTIKEILKLVYQEIDKKGLALISPHNYPEGDYVKPRPLEVGAALNRLRSLKIKEIKYL